MRRRLPKKEEMTMQPAAALALVGWYLMVPSTGRDYSRGNVGVCRARRKTITGYPPEPQMHTPAPLPADTRLAHAVGKSVKSDALAGATWNSFSVVWVFCVCCAHAASSLPGVRTASSGTTAPL